MEKFERVLGEETRKPSTSGAYNINQFNATLARGGPAAEELWSLQPPGYMHQQTACCSLRLIYVLTVDGYEGIIRPVRPASGVLQFEELLQVLVVRILFEVSSDDSMVTVGGRRVISDIVQLSQTADSNL